MKHTAYILYNTAEDRKYEIVNITGNRDEFKHNDITYKIRERGNFVRKKNKLIVKRKILPWFIPDNEIRSYYQAGTPEPLGWTKPKTTVIAGKPISFGAEDLYNASRERTSWTSMFKIGGGRSGILGWILISAVVIGGIAAIIFVVIPLMGGGNILGGG